MYQCLVTCTCMLYTVSLNKIKCTSISLSEKEILKNSASAHCFKTKKYHLIDQSSGNINTSTEFASKEKSACTYMLTV